MVSKMCHKKILQALEALTSRRHRCDRHDWALHVYMHSQWAAAADTTAEKQKPYQALLSGCRPSRREIKCGTCVTVRWEEASLFVYVCVCVCARLRRARVCLCLTDIYWQISPQKCSAVEAEASAVPPANDPTRCCCPRWSRLFFFHFFNCPDSQYDDGFVDHFAG